MNWDMNCEIWDGAGSYEMGSSNCRVAEELWGVRGWGTEELWGWDVGWWLLWRLLWSCEM